MIFFVFFKVFYLVS